MEVTGASFDPQFMFDHPDPYPMFAMLRQAQPVMRAEFMNRVAWVLGYHLARLEARLALTALLDRLPGLRLDPAAPSPTITGLAFRSPKALPVLVA